MRMRWGKEREREKKREESKWLGKNRIFVVESAIEGGGGQPGGVVRHQKKRNQVLHVTQSTLTPSPQTISRSIHVL